MIKHLFVFLLILFIFSISLLENSVKYRLNLSNNSLHLDILNKKINLPTYDKADEIIVNLNPQERYSTAQYLIQDKDFLKNSLQLIDLLFFRKKNAEIILKTPLLSSTNFIHFNPFRSSLIINYGKTYYRFEVNIPDATLEVWDQSKKIENFIVKPPWLNLIIYPIISSLMIACFIYYFLRLLFKTKISSILNQQNSTKKFKISKMDIILGFVFFITGAIIIGLIFFKVFNGMPGFGDEMNYLVQAKIFAAGKFSVKEPANPEFFRVGWMDIFGVDKKLWNFHPPGNSLILMIGQLLKVDWITIPIVAGLVLVTQYFLALNLFENRLVALIHVIVIITSHYFLSLASSYMAHAPSLLFISLFYFFLIRFFKEKRGLFLVASSASIGFAFVIRPLSALLASIIPLIFLLIFLLKQIRKYFTSLVGSLLFGLIISSFVFFYSYKVSGKWTFPYLIKGPEVGQTLKVRWTEGWDYRFKNLFRNSNEFQNRVHSLGYIFNFVFFLFPLFSLSKNNKWLWIVSGYLSFFFYLIVHSFLHWYGWKWEPRMIYDISFLFFLITTYGIMLLYSHIKQARILKSLSIVIAFFLLLYLAVFNLPYRFKTEYRNYNEAPSGVRESIRKNKIHQAIIFFKNNKHLAPYFPENNLSFNGKIIYALSQNEDYDYKLISKFPEKDIYYSTDGIILEKNPNFYKKDIYFLAENLKKNYQSKNIIIVIPWLKSINTSLHDILPGKKIDPNELINLLIQNKIDNNTYIILIDRSRNLVPIISYFYNSLFSNNIGFETPVTLATIKSRNAIIPQKAPFFSMRCYQGTNWNGDVIKDELVTSVDIADCFAEDRSIEWTAYFDLEKSKNVKFYLESDDGSEITIDNITILKANQNGKQTVDIDLEKGKHSLAIKFFNGPDGEYLSVGTVDEKREEQNMSIGSSEFDFYLPQELWN